MTLAGRQRGPDFLPNSYRGKPAEKVTEQAVSYVAGLANLELTSTERERMLRDLNNILECSDRLNELDTIGVPPMAQASSQPGDPASAVREDKTMPCLPHEAAMQNAPQTGGT